MKQPSVLSLAIGMAMLLTGAAALAQTGTPSSRLGWDQSGATLAEVQAFTYRYYPDGAATGTALAGVTCTGAVSPFACQVAFPAFTPGAHTIQLTAGNVAGESVKSAVFSFTFVVVPGAPTNLRIQ